MNRITSVVALMVLLAAVPAIAGESPDRELVEKDITFIIDCDAGPRLDRAVANRRGINVFWFSGTCNGQDVVIDRDGVEIRGVGENPTIVGSVTVDGATRAVLADFSVNGSARDGVGVIRNGEATLSNLVIEGTARRGISVEASAVTINDVAIDGTSSVGIAVIGGQAEIGGTTSVTNAGSAGILADRGANITIRDAAANLTLSNNVVGFATQVNSSTTMFRGTLTVTGNAFDGIAVVGLASFLHGGAAVIESSSNGNNGVFVADNSQWNFTQPIASLKLNDNGAAGLFAFDNGSCLVFGLDTIEITGNGFPGIFSDDSFMFFGGATLAGNATALGGGVDVFLRFNTRVNFGDSNNIASPVLCEEPVWVDPDTTDFGNCEAILGASALLSKMRAKGSNGLPYEVSQRARYPITDF